MPRADELESNGGQKHYPVTQLAFGGKESFPHSANMRPTQAFRLIGYFWAFPCIGVKRVTVPSVESAGLYPNIGETSIVYPASLENRAGGTTQQEI